MKKNIIVSVVIFIIFTTIAVVLDYFNLIGGDKINWDFISLFINNSVVVLIYYLTFCLIDKRTITKESNQNKVAQVMMLETYKRIKENMKIWTPELVAKYIVPKVDFNKTNDPFMEKIKNVPFQYDDYIFEFAKNGVISDRDFSIYIKIKSEYEGFISMTISLFDAPDFWKISQGKMEETMKLAEEMINE